MAGNNLNHIVSDRQEIMDLHIPGFPDDELIEKYARLMIQAFNESQRRWWIYKRRELKQIHDMKMWKISKGLKV